MTLDPDNTPPEVLAGQPQSFLMRLTEGDRKNVIHLTLASLVEVRAEYKNDPSVLTGVADLEHRLVCMLNGVTPGRARVRHVQEPPQ